MPESSQPTSWNKIGKWYDDIVGDQGHYYHQNVIIPGLLKLLNFQDGSSFLDLACGQGILSRHLPPHVKYMGVDIASDLIQAARRYNKNPNCEFMIGDVTKHIPLTKKDFTHGSIILALQNIEDPLAVLKNASKHLVSGARLVIVLNHPCFRIHRQSSWKIDESNKTQYRRIDRYMSSMKIPIQTHPGQGKQSPNSWTFHLPLSSYCRLLKESGFTIQVIDEWCSPKTSDGKAAKMENRSREEFPLFMTIVAVKL